MFLVLKRSSLMRPCFRVPTTYVLVEKYENYFLKIIVSTDSRYWISLLLSSLLNHFLKISVGKNKQVAKYAKMAHLGASIMFADTII